MEIKCVKMIDRSKYFHLYTMGLCMFISIIHLFFDPNETEKMLLNGMLICLAGYIIIDLTITIINFAKFRKNAPMMIDDLQDVLKQMRDDMRDDK